ncbi:MAG: hypothetical protein HFE49_07440 [Clostridia bacterium]|nr:hypothetical protein [Clostridia bacterium]
MYKVTEEKTTIDNKEHTTYGIWYNDEFHVNDISVNREYVENLLQLCIAEQLSPIHLYDVVTDFIGS